MQEVENEMHVIMTCEETNNILAETVKQMMQIFGREWNKKTNREKMLSILGQTDTDEEKKNWRKVDKLAKKMLIRIDDKYRENNWGTILWESRYKKTYKKIAETEAEERLWEAVKWLEQRQETGDMVKNRC